ncbi:MAG: GNAT family N-acetyltransferase [Candidatus Paceibacterota bacterium]
MNTTFRPIHATEKSVIETICQESGNPDIKQFPNYWTRFKNWESNPPCILIDDDTKRIIGFAAFTMQKKGTYCNFYAFSVLPEFRRMGYGERIWRCTLLLAKSMGKTRIKAGANINYSGYAFFTNKLGWKPIAKKGNEYRFDANITDVECIEDFKRIVKNQDIPPDDELSKYKNMEECFL